MTLWLAAGPAAPGPETRRLAEAARFLITLLGEEDRVGVMALPGLGRVLSAHRLTAAHRQAVMRHLTPGFNPPSLPGAPKPPPAGETDPQGGREFLVLLTAGALAPEQADALAAARQLGLTPLWLSLGSEAPAGPPAGVKSFAAGTPDLWPDACLELYTHLTTPELVPLQKRGFFLDATVTRARWVLPARAPAAGRPALIAPDGRVLPAGRPAPGLTWQAGEGFFLADLKNPAPGWWRVHGATPPPRRCLVESQAPVRVWLPAGPLAAHLRPWVAAGGPASEPSAGGAEPAAISLEWQRPDGTWQQLELSDPPPPAASGLPAGARLGLLPPALAPGSLKLRVTAAGPEAHRCRLLELSVLPARGGLLHAGEGIVRLEPEGVLPGGWRGWLGLRSPDSGWAGRFLNLPSPGGLLARLSGPGPGTYTVAVELWGGGSPGLPTVLRPAPLTFSLPGAGTGPETNAGTSPAGLRAKLSRLLPSRALPPPKPPARRLAQTLAWAGLLGGVALLLAVAVMMRRSSNPEAAAADAGASLLAGEQLQALLQERARLAARVEELERALAQLTRENERLRQDLEARAQAIQEKARLASQWQEEALKAQEEARLVQEEYTALYARSRRDKEVLKRP
ncbi:MAG: hypothetical protein K6T55_03010 [Syntrophobacterales bacterium]|nr:hypothetical protein [Syntrophobacterales bacterium]